MSIPLVTGVLLADDHPIVRHGLRDILNAEADFRVVEEVNDGADAVERALQDDIHLPAPRCGRRIAHPLNADELMDPDNNELNDAARQVLAAAQRLSRAAAGERIEPATPATLACIAASLGALTLGCAALDRDAGPAQRRPFDELVHALRRTQRACEAARSSAASGHSKSACHGDAGPGASPGGS